MLHKIKKMGILIAYPNLIKNLQLMKVFELLNSSKFGVL